MSQAMMPRIFMRLLFYLREASDPGTVGSLDCLLYCIVLIGAFISIFPNQLKVPQG